MAMARSIPALVNPELLRWARETAGLDVETAAGKIHRPEHDLRAWEAGKSRPTVAQLREAARVYRRPLATFYLPAPPPDLSAMRDLRRLPTSTPSAFSPELRFLIRSARTRQRWLRDALTALSQPPPTLVRSGSLDDDREELGRRTRALLGVSDAVQQAWYTPAEALRAWVDAIEDAGVFVFQSSAVKVAEMRGFALTDPLAPVIVLNAKDAQTARVFSALHEVVHIVVGEDGVSNPDPTELPAASDHPVEVFCNAVAAEALVPAAAIRNQLGSSVSSHGVDRAIHELSDSYKVSREVIARRLCDLSLISREAYTRRRREYSKAAEEPVEERKRFPFPPHRRAVRDNGRAFTRLVLSAHSQGLVTSGDVSHLLNARLKHLPKIEALVFQPAARGQVSD